MKSELLYQPWLYYQEAQESISYTHKVTGDLDLERLVSGQKPWRLPQSRESRPKKLIIADWRIATYSEEALAILSQQLEEASSAGFSLYIWNNGKVILFSKDALITAKKDICPALHHDIATAAFNAKLGFTKENLCVLDDYWMECFLNTEPPYPRSISLQLYKNLSKENQEKLRKIIPVVTPQITHFVRDTYPPQYKDEQELGFLEASTHYQFATINNGVSISELQTLLIDEPTLKTLDLRSCEQLAALIDLKANSLKFLESLNLSRSNISIENLRVFLEAAPKLKTLDLRSCEQLAALIDLKANSLKFLESLDLAWSNISIENLRVFLEVAPKLKTLNLGGCKQLAARIDLKPNSLKFLESLDLAWNDISIKNLRVFLEAAPKLKTLNLGGCKQLAAPIDLKQNSLSNLESLDLSDSNISTENLRVFLEAAPKLKTLGLNGCKKLAAPVDLKPNSLSNLESLDLPDSNISTENLRVFLEAAPKLKTLGLNGCQKLAAPIDLKPNSLSNLESLDLSDSNISTENLRVFLEAAPKLKTLNLNGCKKLAAPIDLKPNSLSNLESLDLYGSDISIENLRVFLEAAPKLKSLDLSDCKQLAAPIGLKPNSLKFLESLDLFDSNISTENLRVFLEAAPKLKTLDLGDCKQLAAPIDLKPNSLKFLESLVLSDNNISIENLRVFLEAAPKLKKLNLSRTGIYKESAKFIPPHIDVVWDSAPNIAVVKENPNPFVPQTAHGETGGWLDPVHNPADEKENKPTPEDFKFVYKGSNQTKNQLMVIEKISQYLVLTNRSPETVRSIQTGICYDISLYFLDIGAPAFESFLGDAKAWNGVHSTLTAQLESHFDALIPRLEQPYARSKYYLGEHLADFLKQQKGKYSLHNPWHAIALQHTERGVEIYDPNFVNGSQLITSEELLLSTVTNSLGLLVATSLTHVPPPVISNPNQFLEVGGLLALHQYANREDMLACIQMDTPWTMAALQGLFFLTRQGVPVWAVCISSGSIALQDLSITLLLQLRQKKPELFEVQLIHSLEAISPQEQHEYLTKLRRLLAQSSGVEAIDVAAVNPQEQHEHLTKPRRFLAQDSEVEAIDVMESSFVAIEEKIYEEKEKSAFEKSFTTWGFKKPEADSMYHYGFNCLTHQERSLLIQTSSSLQTQGLRFGLENIAHNIGQPFFYIDTPDALACAMPFIKNERDKGVLQAGPGGVLYDFLNTHEERAITLCVNYDTFEADDMVRLNTLLDSKPSVDGIALPDKCKVIGIMNTHRDNVYEGSDFYSRFTSIHTCPLSEPILKDNIPPIPYLPASMQASDTVIIDLFEKIDWKSDVLGQWVLINNQLFYQKGWLESALKTGKPLEIKNLPLGHTDFELCWQEALLRGTFYHANHTIELTRPINIVLSHGYDWSDLQHYFTLKPRPSILDKAFDPMVLNESTFNQFFSHYAYQHTENVFMPLPGQLERCSDHTLEIYVTQTLQAAQWARLLSTAKQYHVNLDVLLAQGVELPSELYNEQMLVDLPRLEIDGSKTHTTSLILSQDIDTTLAMYFNEHEGLVIDVSECEPEDLLEKTDVRLVCSEVPHLEFQHITQALIKGLSDDKTIILKGYFSRTLMNALVPFLLKRYQEQKPRGRLVLITEQEEAFNALPYETHDISASMKLRLLNIAPWMEEELLPLLEKESLSTLKARRDFLVKHPSASSENFRIGLRHIDTKNNQPDDVDLSQSAEATRKEMARRRDAINDVLDTKPFVFLAGLSGVGKSTFVKTELKTKKDRLYQEEAAIFDWIADQNPEGRKLLFLDEANLSPTHWSMFEGLFQAPPGLLYQGTFYPLTPEHKVIFAGNPLNFGGERALASLFTRHGNTVLLEPLPLTVIFEKIIKPVFENSPYKVTSHDIAMPFLNVYRFLMQCSETELLISPRELQMMVLLTLAHKQHSPDADTQHIAQYYAHALAKCLVPNEHRQAFDIEFSVDDLPLPPAGKLKEDFLITKSRWPLFQLLTDVVVLRELRQTVLETDAERYGGLGGMVIEGEPGIGKTEFVLHVLRQYGFEEEHDLEQPSTKNKPFYRIPVSLTTSQKKARLLKAFDEGALVIIDEINSSPMLEKLLNALRMGTTPDGFRPKKPGFMMIGTQNPPSFAGRIAPSAAVIHRNINVMLEQYPQDEMIEILMHKGHQKMTANNIAKAFLKQLKIATDNKLSPLPTFRDVMKLSDSLITASFCKRLQHNVKLMDEKEDVFENEDIMAEGDLPNRKKSKSPSGNEHGFFKNIKQSPSVHESMEIEHKIILPQKKVL